ncbi:unnamed protein product, partial [Urochloa humidicola]
GETTSQRPGSSSGIRIAGSGKLWDGGDAIGVVDSQPPVRLLWIIGSLVHGRKQRAGDLPSSPTRGAEDASSAVAPTRIDSDDNAQRLATLLK